MIGKVQTIRIVPLRYQFPRVRNLPNRVNCIDQTGKIDCIFFNSHEGYVRKVLPLNEEVTINGKISNYKGRYQITNPTYISQDSSLIENIDNKYSLTEGITEKTYNKIINQILKNLPILTEWHDKDILKIFNNQSWNESIIKLHDPKNIENYKSPDAGFFLWLEVKDGEESSKVLWTDYGVKVLPGKYLGRESYDQNPGINYVRVALVAPIDEMKSGLIRIKNCFY